MSSTPTSATVRCQKCGRALRSPEATALGFGTACAKALGVGRWAPEAREARLKASLRRMAARRRLKAVLGPVEGQGLLFPDHDAPLVERAKEANK